MLALKLLGYDRGRLYDGSWAEWSADPSLPVEVSTP
jgi:thiosulfate/3-mercaptopyruvate sulfurtransferase